MRTEKKNYLKIAVSLMSEAKRKGQVEYRSGAFLTTKEKMIEDQKEWADEDEAKHIDFKNDDFWVTTDDGQEPEGYTRPEFFADHLKDLGYDLSEKKDIL